MRHGVTGVTQICHASVSHGLPRNYAVGAAQQCPDLVDGGASDVRSAVRKTLYRLPRDK